ncbi:MAG TPA: hypothetical protein VIG89_01560 [Candidatus Acidoferrales bacterium]
METIRVPAKSTIIKATVVALLVAAVVLVTTVLPAEYSVDPLGTGQALGLLNIAAAEEAAQNASATAPAGPGGLAPQPADYRTDTTEFKLAPNEWVEYKYRMEKGQSLLYSWKSTGLVVYDMHSEEDGAPPDTAQSFGSDEKLQDFGAYTAPFPGIHGWYWQNQTDQPLTVQLKTTGFYSAIHEFHEGTHLIRELK